MSFARMIVRIVYMGRDVGTFLDFEDIKSLFDKANEKFENSKKFKSFLCLGYCSNFYFSANVSTGNKKLPSVKYDIYNLDGRIGVMCDNAYFNDNCKILKETFQSFIENSNEKV